MKKGSVNAFYEDYENQSVIGRIGTMDEEMAVIFNLNVFSIAKVHGIGKGIIDFMFTKVVLNLDINLFGVSDSFENDNWICYTDMIKKKLIFFEKLTILHKILNCGIWLIPLTNTAGNYVEIMLSTKY